MKKLIVLAAASVVAASAQAEWNNGVDMFGTKAGELILTVYNDETRKGFVQDLNALTLDYLKDIENAPTNFTINAEGIEFVGGLNAPLRYTVAGLNNSIETEEYPFIDDDSFTQEGFAFTANKKPSLETSTALTRNSFTAGIQNVQVEVNRSTVSADGDTYMHEDGFGNNGKWGSGLFISRNKFQFDDASSAFGETNDFWGYNFYHSWAITPELQGDEEYRVSKLGTWLVEGDQLTFTAEPQVNEIPVPAAAWLFGSALVGLAATRRRK